jgi:hypothetical protein
VPGSCGAEGGVKYHNNDKATRRPHRPLSSLPPSSVLSPTMSSLQHVHSLQAPPAFLEQMSSSQSWDSSVSSSPYSYGGPSPNHTFDTAHRPILPPAHNVSQSTYTSSPYSQLNHIPNTSPHTLPYSPNVSSLCHEDLVHARNPAYMQLWTIKTNLEKEVHHLKYAMDLHCDSTHFSFYCRQGNHPSTAGASSATTPFTAALGQLPQPLLSYPRPPESLANLRFPTLEAWKRRHGKSTAILYMEDATGHELPPRWITAWTRTIRGCWGSLVDLGLGPPTWATRNSMVWDWLRRMVYSEFPDAMLCEHDWKLEYYCLTHYSGWRTDYLGSAQAVQAHNSNKVGSSTGRDAKAATGRKQRAPQANTKDAQTDVLDTRKRSRSPSMRLADNDDILHLAKHVKLVVCVSACCDYGH